MIPAQSLCDESRTNSTKVFKPSDFVLPHAQNGGHNLFGNQPKFHVDIMQTTFIMVDEMETEFPYVEITPELQKIVGKPDPGTRIYRRKGTYRESGIWFQAMDWFTDDTYVSPGGVSMYAPVSRAAVHRRLKEGRLTAFAFHVVHNEKTFFGTEREAKSRPYIYIPVSECKAWAKELERKQSKLEFSEEEDRSDEFIAKDPADRKNKKVRYTDEFLYDVDEKAIFKAFWNRKDDDQ